jgi:PPK2 family polyphosphate:nucleotide phosphotransferase
MAKSHTPLKTGKFVVPEGSKVDLRKYTTRATIDIDKEQAGERLRERVARLATLQEKLYAEDRWAVLLVFQGMDAAGKDSAIEHVLTGLNPQGVQVYSFKSPSREELDHDYLWRSWCRLPERGRIGVFNRSYYEEVLIVRVRPEILAGQRLPASLVTDDIWKERYQDIRNFERYLVRNGTLVLKFFLHVSRKEQERRFLARLEDPAKNWKFAHADLKESDRWPKYQKAFANMLEGTSTRHAPWHVVPADQKWFARLAVATIVVNAVEKLDPQFPTVTKQMQAELAEAKKLLTPGKKTTSRQRK